MSHWFRIRFSTERLFRLFCTSIYSRCTATSFNEFCSQILDIDECKEQNSCNRNTETCVNIPGSYRCVPTPTSPKPVLISSSRCGAGFVFDPQLMGCLGNWWSLLLTREVSRDFSTYFVRKFQISTNAKGILAKVTKCVKIESEASSAIVN